jgi:DNA-binding winged helix-turn-helix (wHTH) protein
LQRQVLFREGVRIKLPTKVHEVLLILIEQPGDVVTREVLRARLWPTDVHVNYDANVNTTVNKLRQVLGDSPEQPVFVETIPRKGYAFIAKVEYTDQAPAQAPWPKIARAEAIQEVPA